jgi:hypothetical protein
MHQFNLIKANVLLLFIAMSAGLYAQNASVEYFEVYTKVAHKHGNSGFAFNKDSIMARINALPDTADTYATMVVSVSDPAQIDSVYFTLANSQGQQVYNVALQLSALQSDPNFKVVDKTIYLTVGPYPYLKHFTATAKVKSTNGSISGVKSFAKN